MRIASSGKLLKKAKLHSAEFGFTAWKATALSFTSEAETRVNNLAPSNAPAPSAKLRRTQDGNRA